MHSDVGLASLMAAFVLVTGCPMSPTPRTDDGGSGCERDDAGVDSGAAIDAGHEDAGLDAGQWIPAWAEGGATFSLIAIEPVGEPQQSAAQGVRTNIHGAVLGVGGTGAPDAGDVIQMFLHDDAGYPELWPGTATPKPFGLTSDGDVVAILYGDGARGVLRRSNGTELDLPLTDPGGVADGPTICGGIAGGDNVLLAVTDGGLRSTGIVVTTPFGTPYFPFVTACTSAGVVVGTVAVDVGDPFLNRYHPFVWSDGGTTLLEGMGRYSGANDIAESGVIAGYVTNGSVVQGAVWEHDFTVRIAPAEGLHFTEAFAVNSKGVVVGIMGGKNAPDSAFVWWRGTIKKLDALLPADAGWELINALDVNDDNVIVGAGMLNGVRHSYRLRIEATAQ